MQMKTSHDFLGECLVQKEVERGRAITCPTDLVIVVGPQNSVMQHLLKPFLKLTLLICIKGRNDVSISIE